MCTCKNMFKYAGYGILRQIGSLNIKRKLFLHSISAGDNRKALRELSSKFDKSYCHKIRENKVITDREIDSLISKIKDSNTRIISETSKDVKGSNILSIPDILVISQIIVINSDMCYGIKLKAIGEAYRLESKYLIYDVNRFLTFPICISVTILAIILGLSSQVFWPAIYIMCILVILLSVSDSITDAKAVMRYMDSIIHEKEIALVTYNIYDKKYNRIKELTKTLLSLDLSEPIFNNLSEILSKTLQYDYISYSSNIDIRKEFENKLTYKNKENDNEDLKTKT